MTSIHWRADQADWRRRQIAFLQRPENLQIAEIEKANPERASALREMASTLRERASSMPPIDAEPTD
ncbi:hypothetical protein CH306_27510 [Rhodococcus sp. 15-725-2-2b]|nr:hypothetical protein CH277_28285 [Rhodococcus sp. 06-469-3-2]OZD40860.1 hypothetical protein CH264_24635 [Rhodococcus sp. 06-1477-1A]OZE01653.1 hypothetical protein CH250_26670 [Rhodococcus sp. 05-2255-3C]OZE12109.1 hypothetical protein CH249_09390 [Rhodococcus sp. 05-2255-3B1]OZE17177.1 hypothetical protein CH255_19040 [Rhodococcus sp. 05-2255-2A2]OZE66469.1 hypothetical protein CH306_27510 [Rhodococcus sp. 15-725-2-2b]